MGRTKIKAPRTGKTAGSRGTPVEWIVGIGFLVLVVLGVVLAALRGRPAVVYEEEGSSFDGYTVIGDTVELRCTVVLKNVSGSEKKVTLLGQFPEDLGKLVVEDRLIALNAEDHSSLFTVPAGQTRSFSVIFAAGYAGTDEKVPGLPVITVEN